MPITNPKRFDPVVIAWEDEHLTRGLGFVWDISPNDPNVVDIVHQSANLDDTVTHELTRGVFRANHEGPLSPTADYPKWTRSRTTKPTRGTTSEV